MPRARRPRPIPPSAADLDGFSAGLSVRLSRERAGGSPRADLEEALARADRARARGEVAEALDRMEAVEAALDSGSPAEVELQEFPRGLVGYTPRGERGAPLEPEDSPLAHRYQLLGRLADLVALSAEERGSLILGLRRAERALAENDPARAKAELDAVQVRIEQAQRRPPA